MGKRGPKPKNQAIAQLLTAADPSRLLPAHLDNPEPKQNDQQAEESSDSSTIFSTGSTPDNFERVAAQVPPVIGETAAGPEGSPASAGPEASTPATFDIQISRQAVEHWIDVPFQVLAKLLDDPDCNLEQWEKEIWIPAVQGVLNRYLPDLLKRLDKPELAMLGLAATTYIAMRAKLITGLMRGVPKKPPVSSPADSTMPGSVVSQGSSGSQEPARVF